nr:MAG: major capsid protein [Microvirus sp.]
MVQVVELPAAGRVNRKPAHSFQIRQRPWQIQPFMIAPVLPGETLKNLLCQARVVTDPIKNPLIGWWFELYFFYVKHRDLTQREHFTSMVLEAGYDLSSLNAAAKVEHYHYGGAIDWTQHCLERVVEEYFRDEGEAWDGYLIGNLPAASVAGQSWLDSVTDTTALDAGTPIAAGDTPEELDGMARQWEFMRAHKLTNMSYEDFLATYGVRKSRQEIHKPELVRYVRDWTYPSNTINPSDGKPSSACSWAIAERADKARFFAEPGFLFGVAVARPKVYFSAQKGSAASLLADAFSWLPAVMQDAPYTSLKELAAGAGPLQGTTNGYWVDVRDLFLYGDQFVNFALTATDAGMVALPTSGLQKRYATATDADALFVTPATANLVRYDGIASLTIAGRQQDHT